MTTIMHKVTSRGSMKDESRSLGETNGRKLNDSSDSNGNGSSSAMAPSMDLDEWRKAISTPTRYRVGSASIHMRPRDILQAGVVILIIIVVIFLIYTRGSGTTSVGDLIVSSKGGRVYNSKYPLTKPLLVPDGKKYRIGVITDLDHDSKVVEQKNLWMSHYLKGYLTVYDDMKFEVTFESKSVDLHQSLSLGGRGMELSELVVFDGSLITVDDRTGVVYKINKDQVVPWVILSDGPGDVSKGSFLAELLSAHSTQCTIPSGFKSEWATVKDGHLYIGGLGKEWTTTTGEVVNLNPQYVKRVGPDGSVEHLDWHKHYDLMRETAGYPKPGYMVHESGVWSDIHRKWFFLPRRASTEKYDDKLDERRAANVLIICSEDFSKVEIIKPFGPHSATHGFSSFKFIPGTNDEYILALKSEEDDGKTASYIMVFDLKGNMVMKEQTIAGEHKYEGVEFV